MTLEEQLAKLQRDFEKANETHAASLQEMQAENDRMKTHMQDAVRKEKEVKNAKRDLEQQMETLRAEAELGEEQTTKMNEIIAQKMEKAQERFDTQLNEVTTQLTEAQSNFSTLKGKYDGERIGGALRKAAEASGVLPSAIDDVISRAGNMFSINEEGGIESRDSDGNLRRINKKIASPETFVDSLRETATHLWPNSQSSGAQGNADKTEVTVNPFDPKTINYTAQAKLKKSDPDKAARLEEAAKGAAQ